MSNVSIAGWRLTRRGFLASGAGALIGSRAMPAAPACTLMAEQEEGPYYLDGPTLRQDLTEGRPGLPVRLRVVLLDSKGCAPLEGAALDIWHCDALGVYSGFTPKSPDGRGGPGGPPPGFGGRGPGGPPPRGRGGPGGRARQVDATRFLRGVQLTNRNGVAEFNTIYPGWYLGRAIHIHVKVHLGGRAGETGYTGGHVSHTGQFFFPEEVTAEIARLQPYATRLELHRTTQEEDGVFRGQHGSGGMLSLERIEKGTNEGGFVATIAMAVDPEATPDRVGRGGPRGGE